MWGESSTARRCQSLPTGSAPPALGRGGATLMVLGAAAPRENRKLPITYKCLSYIIKHHTNATKGSHPIIFATFTSGTRTPPSHGELTHGACSATACQGPCERSMAQPLRRPASPPQLGLGERGQCGSTTGVRHIQSLFSFLTWHIRGAASLGRPLLLNHPRGHRHSWGK